MKNDEGQNGPIFIFDSSAEQAAQLIAGNSYAGDRAADTSDELNFASHTPGLSSSIDSTSVSLVADNLDQLASTSRGASRFGQESVGDYATDAAVDQGAPPQALIQPMDLTNVA